MKPNDFGQRLRDLRTQRGFTQEQVASAASLTRSTISQWESGLVAKVDAEPLLRVARYLGTSLDWLIEGRASAAAEERAPYHVIPAALLDCWSDLTASQQAALVDTACQQAEHNRALLKELRRR
jgi:transcriptional regulator with XRE-family HTH domain